MTRDWVQDLADRLIEGGLAGTAETVLLNDLCERLSERGLQVGRAMVLIDTLHPIHEGRLFRWQRDTHTANLTEYGRTDETDAGDSRWRRSPFYRLLQAGESHLRRRLVDGSEAEFPHFAELRAYGMTDYVALVKPFAAGGSICDMDCVYA